MHSSMYSPLISSSRPVPCDVSVASRRPCSRGEGEERERERERSATTAASRRSGRKPRRSNPFQPRTTYCCRPIKPEPPLFLLRYRFARRSSCITVNSVYHSFNLVCLLLLLLMLLSFLRPSVGAGRLAREGGGAGMPPRSRGAQPLQAVLDDRSVQQRQERGRDQQQRKQSRRRWRRLRRHPQRRRGRARLRRKIAQDRRDSCLRGEVRPPGRR